MIPLQQIYSLMSYPPLTSAELNKFSDACKHNNMVVFEKYYQKMLRHNSTDPVYITTAVECVEFAINYDNHEMFEKLMNIACEGRGWFLWDNIIRNAVPHHLWALKDTLAHPKIPAFEDHAPNHALSNWAQSTVGVSPELEWLISHTRDSSKVDAAAIASRLKRWDFLDYVATHLTDTTDTYARWRMGLDAAFQNCPNEVLQRILGPLAEDNSMRLLDERKHVFTDTEYARVWSAFNQVYSTQQAQRIEMELETHTHSLNQDLVKRKM